MTDVLPTHLTVERQTDPLAVAVPRPLFGWRLPVAQIGYEVVVARGEDEVWSSGRVASRSGVDIAYGGAALVSDTDYSWRVRAFTADGPTGWSEGVFGTSLLRLEDWTARWAEPAQPTTLHEVFTIPDVLAGVQSPEAPPTERLRPTQLVRAEIELPVRPVRARLYASAHGVYRAELNGAAVGDEVLAPGYDPYFRRLAFQAYDVTGMLDAGPNVLGFEIADGWWAGRIGITGSSAQYGDRLAVIWQLSIDDADGRRTTIGSGEVAARSHRGARDYSDIFIGERFDARAEQPGWSRPGFDAMSWSAVEHVREGKDVLVPFIGEPIRRTQVLRMRTLSSAPQRILLDAEQVMAGRVRLRLRAGAGTVVTVRHAEVTADGEFFDNVMGPNNDQVDQYLASGAGDETFEPEFTFHGFRYALVEADGPIELLDAEAVVIGSDLRRTSRLRTSDPSVNRLHENVVWSQRGNFLAVATDCPQRERAGWTGDLQVYAPTATIHMDVRGFLQRWFAAVRAEQFPDGGIPTVVPVIPSMHAGLSHDVVVSAGWGDVIVHVPWTLWQRYGDRRSLEENYSAMRRWVDYQQRHAVDVPERLAGRELEPEQARRQAVIWNAGPQFGDWMVPSAAFADPSVATLPGLPTEIVTAMYHARTTALFAEVAEELGHAAEARDLRERAALIAEAFVGEYVDVDGRLLLDAQGAYVLALAFGLIPGDRRDRAFNRLVELIEANGRHLDTGFLSTPYLLEVLWQHGAEDLARELYWTRSSPSWMYALDHGATTVWEVWEAIAPDGTPTRSSFNHYAFGSVDEWVFRREVGIEALAPAYAKVRIAPDLTGPLDELDGAIDTVRGEIAVRWRRDGDIVTLDVETPAGVEAEVVAGGRVRRHRGGPLRLEVVAPRAG